MKWRQDGGMWSGCVSVFMMIEWIGCERRGERGGDSVSDVVESE